METTATNTLRIDDTWDLVGQGTVMTSEEARVEADRDLIRERVQMAVDEEIRLIQDLMEEKIPDPVDGLPRLAARLIRIAQNNLS